MTCRAGFAIGAASLCAPIIMSLVTPRLLALVGLIGVSLVVVVIARSMQPGEASAGRSPFLPRSLPPARLLRCGFMPALTQNLAKHWQLLRRLHELVAILPLHHAVARRRTGFLLGSIVVGADGECGRC